MNEDPTEWILRCSLWHSRSVPDAIHQLLESAAAPRMQSMLRLLRMVANEAPNGGLN